jgi:integrase
MSKLTALSVKNAKHTHRRQELPAGHGLYLVLQPKPSTVRSWAYRYRHGGKSYKITLGTAVDAEPGFVPPEGSLTLSMARTAAGLVSTQREQGKNPAEERKPKGVAGDTFEVIARKCFERARDQNGDPLRSAGRQVRDMERLAFPVIGSMAMVAIKRSVVTRLLDKIEDENGQVAADGILACLSKVMGWYATRSDDYNSPIVKHMRRSNPKARARKHTLSDAELQKIWLAAEASDSIFAKIAQFLLLTAARRHEAGGMKREEVKDVEKERVLYNVWTCPRERSKTKVPIERPLSKLAQEVLAKAPRIGGDLFFTLDGVTPYDNFSKDKVRFDAKCGVSGYTVHDLRRTARSLMARAGIRDEVAERCLAHTVKGVKGVYNRHEYLAEKAQAYEKLASLIQLIVYPQDNVRVLAS